MQADDDGVSSLSSSSMVGSFSTIGGNGPARRTPHDGYSWALRTTPAMRAGMTIALDEAVSGCLDRRIRGHSELSQHYRSQEEMLRQPIRNADSPPATTISGPLQAPGLGAHPNRRKYPIPADGPARQKEYGDWLREASKNKFSALNDCTKKFNNHEKPKVTFTGMVTPGHVVICNPI